MDKKSEIGTRIKQLRVDHGMTQSELAKAIGKSTSSITMYETGRRAPDYETLEAIADIFNVRMALLQGTDAATTASRKKVISEGRAALINLVETVPEDQIPLLYKVVQVFLASR